MAQGKLSVSRRDLLKGLGVASLGMVGFGLNNGISRAQTSPTDQEVSAYYRFKVGDAEMIAVLDTSFQLPLTIFNAEGTEEETAEFLADLLIPVQESTIRSSVVNLVMINGDTIALFDTGNGPGAGKLVPTLDALGITTDTVTDILVSHWHPDHTNGLSIDGELVYPNAQVHVTQADFDLLQSGAEFAAGAAAKLQPAVDADQVTTFAPGDDVISGVTAIGTPGHTPGHTSWMIENSGSQLLHFVDSVINAYISPANPTWVVGFDADGQVAVESRQMILDMAAADAIPTIGYHFPFPGTGYVRPDGDVYEFVPFAF